MGNGAFEAYEPLNALKPFAEDVWLVDGPEIRMSFCGLGLPFPTRMTVVRLPDGALWLHSPVAPDVGLIDIVQALGPVRHLVAPSTMHYWWVADWKRHCPQAVVHAAPGLAEAAKRDVPIDAVLDDAAPPAWGGAIDQVVVRSAVFTEVDFFHKPSRTLILTDLIENFEPDRVKRTMLRGLIRLSGAAHPDGKAPIDMRASFWGRSRTLRAAVRKMIAWSPEQIVLAHGRCYERDGTAELRRAFRWVL